MEIRDLTKEKDPQVFVPKLKNICADCGIAVVFVKPFSKVSAYGASCWLNPEKAFIQLSLRGKTADSLWFTIFHELGHILNHSKKELFIEIDDKCSSKSLEEQEADEFASETLIPKLRFNQWVKENSHKLSANNLSEFARELNVAAGILVGKLQYMGYVKYSEFSDLKFKYDWREANYA